MLHTFVALVQDKPGVLTRVASLFRRLNINIVSLTVGESERTDVSRMTIVCEAPDHAAHRIRASLYKLEITVDVDEVGRADAVIRELCLLKVGAGPSHPLGQHSRSQIFERECWPRGCEGPAPTLRRQSSRMTASARPTSSTSTVISSL